MKHRTHWLAFATGLALVSLSNAQGSNPGEVLYEQKISSTSGGFTGDLDADDAFAFECEPLGDLDGDAVQDLAVSAIQDDDGGSSRGAVWILFLNRDGTVKAHQKISSTSGGFTGTLDNADFFGAGIANLGDLDGDDVIDLGVGASGDDDGGMSQGAVWILFLNVDGTVKSQQKISESAGGFTGTLDDGDSFGNGLGSLGDLDGDGLSDLAVGAIDDDDGGTGRGAVWILFLNSNGTVKSHAKISSTAGSFTGPLANGDAFGSAVAGLGDLDGAGGSDGAIAVGASLDDQAGSQAGAIWILFLSSAGSVLSEQKVTEGVGGFTGNLDPVDVFGGAVENLVDIGGPGSLDIAVAASSDDDGGSERGAVWILSLDTSGTVVSEQKVSTTQGGFQGSVVDGDQLGSGIGRLGDLDLDGRTDIALGAFGDDDGGTNVGAVWVCFLNDGTLNPSRWTGAIDRDWTDSGNWMNGVVPSSTQSAIIPNVANDPLVSDNLQACNALVLAPNGSLELNGSFAVHGGGTIQGTVPGTGELRAEGAGTFGGVGTISVKTVFNQDVTVQGGPLTIADDLDVREDLTVEAAGELVVSGTADLDPATTAVLSGAGTLDLNGAVDLQMTDGTSVPRLEIAGSLSIDSAAFTPSAGTVRFDGAAAQTVTQLSGGATTLFHVEVGAASAVTVVGDLSVLEDLELDGDLDVGSDLDVDGDFRGASTSSLSAGGITFGGDIEHAGMLSSSNRIVINEPSTATLVVDVTDPFPLGLDVDVGGRLVLLSDLTVQGDVFVLDGTLAAGADTTVYLAGPVIDGLVIEAGARLETESFALALPGAPPVTVRGVLAVEPGGTLQLSASAVSIESGGTLRVVSGTVRGLAGGGYALTVGPGATLAAQDFVFRDMGIGGVVVHRDALLAAAPLDLRAGTFTRASPGGILLRIDRAAPATLYNLRFEDPQGVASNNVRVGITSAPIAMRHWTGRFGGSPFEDDPLGDPGRLDWGPAKLRSPPPPTPPPPAPLVSAGSSASPPAPTTLSGGERAMDSALAGQLDGTAAEFVVEAGTYAAFTVDGGRGRSTRLMAAGPARIDTSRGPVEIRGLEAGEVIELAGFELLGSAGPALVVADSRGAVRLERCEIEGDILLAAASAVLLDECEGKRLTLARGSRAQVRGGGMEAIELGGCSHLASWGLAAAVRVAPDSRWIDHGARWPRLELVAGGGALRLDSSPGELGWLGSSEGLDLSSSKHGWALELRRRTPLGFLSAGDAQPIDARDARPGAPRFYQALVLDAERATLTASNLVIRF